MKNLNYLLLILFYFSIHIGNGQNIGINTTDPRATLHVAGDFKFIPDNTITATRLIATDGTGNILEYPLSDSFNIVNNTLTVSIINDNNIILIGDYDQSPMANFVSSWDNMDLGLRDYNAYNTVIRVKGETASYEVTGFADGYNGRIIYFFNSQMNNMTFKNLSASSDPENQIITGTGGDESINAEGVAEFIYDSSIQKWILINIRT